MPAHSRTGCRPGALQHSPRSRTGTPRRSHGWPAASARTRTAGTGQGVRRTPSSCCWFLFLLLVQTGCLLYITCTCFFPCRRGWFAGALLGGHRGVLCSCGGLVFNNKVFYYITGVLSSCDCVRLQQQKSNMMIFFVFYTTIR